MGVLLNLLVLLVILTPAFRAVWDVSENTVNSPHYDDFTFTEDWLKYKEGTLTLGDLFSMHMEHRVTLPRMMAIAAHILGGSDIRWQNVYTLLLLFGMLWNLVVIWRRTTGATLRESWLPLLLMSSVLFCAIQWQPIMWAILFEAYVPIFAFTVILRIGTTRMNPWVGLVCNALLCVAAMLSFGNGLITWMLAPFSMWFQRPDLSVRTRGSLLGAWVVVAATALALHFCNYHNSVQPQFAYGADKQMNAMDSIKHSLGNDYTAFVVKAASFTAGVLGGHLSRGLHMQNIVLAQVMGGISIVLLLLGLGWMLKNFRDTELFPKVMPWALLGLFALGTAMLIMLGRVGLTRSGSGAILPRYTCHAVPLTLALIALAWIWGRRLLPRLPALRTLGLLTAGGLLVLSGIEWVYGELRMELWFNARMQGKALMTFAEVIPDKSILGQIAGDGGYCADILQRLGKVHAAPFPLLKDLRLDNFRISSKKVLKHRLAGFDELHETKSAGTENPQQAQAPG